MNHTDIEEQQVAERYVMGQLSPEEADLFEEHYLSCQECLDRLELAESMERGFKRAAGQDAARLAATRQLAVVAWLARLGRSRQLAALVTVFFVAALLPGLFALRQVRERDRELAAANQALKREERNRSAGSQAAAEAESLRQKLDASRRDLIREQEALATANRQLDSALQPQTNVPILSFQGPERGSVDPGQEPSHKIHLPQPPGWMVLTFAVEGEQQAYRVVLRDAGGRELWRGSGLRLDADKYLTLSFHSSKLAPGDYTLSVEGLPPGGKPVSAGRFTFRVEQ